MGLVFLQGYAHVAIRSLQVRRRSWKVRRELERCQRLQVDEVGPSQSHLGEGRPNLPGRGSKSRIS